MEPLSFPLALADLWRRKVTGTLVLQGDGPAAAISFRRGQPVHVDQPTLGNALGRLLLRDGTLNQEQFAQAVARMTESLVENEDVRFGEVLLELGLVTPHRIAECLAAQMNERLDGLFAWHNARGIVYEEDIEATIGLWTPSVRQAILKGIKHHVGPPHLSALLPTDRRAPLSFAEPREVLQSAYGCTTQEARLLHLVDGELGVDAILSRTHLDVVHAEQVLAALSCAQDLVLRGAVELRPPTLPVPVQRSPETARVAVARLRPKPDSDRIAQMNAEAAFQHARRLYRQDNIAGARADFRRAAELHPEAVEYVLHIEWCDYVLAQRPGAAARALSRAIELSERIIREEPSLPLPHLIVALAAVRRGDLTAADRACTRARSIEPDHPDLRRVDDELAAARARVT